MNFTNSWISSDIADNYDLFLQFPCTMHVFHGSGLFLMGGVAFRLRVPYLQWQLSGQHFAWALARAADGDSAASATSRFP